MEDLSMKENKHVRRDSASSQGSEMEAFNDSKVRYHISVDREISSVVWFCVWDTEKFPNNQYYHWLPHNRIDPQSIEFYLKSKERKTARRMNMDDEGGRATEEYIVISDDDDEEENKEDQEMSVEEKDPSTNMMDEGECFDLTNEADVNNRCGDHQQVELHEDGKADDASMQEKPEPTPKVPKYIMMQTMSDNDYKMVSIEELKLTQPAFVASFLKAVESGNYNRIPEGSRPPDT